MDLSRESIERSDFPRATDGVDPAAVEAHLREVADAVEKLTRSVRRLAAEIEERAGVVEAAMERKAAPPPPPPPPPPKAEPEPEPPEPEPEPEPEPAPEPAAPGGADAPRLIALNMVLNGSSREEVARYLDENFDLEDPGELLDEVWERANS
ncbi:MAG: hypothetical protein JW895_14205 [Thermoleophilaceae bacterium]|nr:hypothetical protein [Thermoleophilaceae bacterium]